MWYILDEWPDQGAWYWTGEELADGMGMGMIGVLDRHPRVVAEAEAEESISEAEAAAALPAFETFCQWVNDPRWTMPADHELVRLANVLCNADSADPEHLLMRHAKPSDVSCGSPSFVALRSLQPSRVAVHASCSPPAHATICCVPAGRIRAVDVRPWHA